MRILFKEFPHHLVNPLDFMKFLYRNRDNHFTLFNIINIIKFCALRIQKEEHDSIKCNKKPTDKLISDLQNNFDLYSLFTIHYTLPPHPILLIHPRTIKIS